jgi:hypothetical protein
VSGFRLPTRGNSLGLSTETFICWNPACCLKDDHASSQFTLPLPSSPRHRMRFPRRPEPLLCQYLTCKHGFRNLQACIHCCQTDHHLCKQFPPPSREPVSMCMYPQGYQSASAHPAVPCGGGNQTCDRVPVYIALGNCELWTRVTSVLRPLGRGTSTAKLDA